MPARGSKSTAWRRRALKAGLTRETLQTLTGAHSTSVWRWLEAEGAGAQPMPPAVRSIIVAWELMDDARRQAWLRVNTL